MIEKNASSRRKADLRNRAEKVVKEKAAKFAKDVERQTPKERRQALHELRVHQVELEIQNEELRRAQEELEASRSRYFDLYDLAPVGYVTVNKKGTILEANLNTESLLGVPRGALVKQLLTRFICREDQDIYYHKRKILFESGEPQAYELRMQRQDATTFWAQMEAAAAQDADGEPVCRLVIIEISERKRAEELRIQNERFTQVLDGLDALVYVADMKTHEVVFINRYGENIWGDIKGRLCWREIQSGQKGPCEFCTNSKLIGPDGNPTEGVVWEFQNTVNKHWYDCRDRAICWPDGRIVRIEIATDITRRKEAEEALAAESHRLAEINTALRVLLQRREEDQKEMERRILANVQKLVLPEIEKLRRHQLNDVQANCLEGIAAGLEHVISPFLQNLTARFADFTPREIQVANMVREGKTSKEIAQLFNSSIRSIEFHRDNIRKKLGLNREKANLRSFLMRLSEK